MTERQLQNAIINLLRLNGWFAYSQDTKGTYDAAKGCFRSNPSRVTGVSDILAIKNIRVVWIEVKKLHKKQTPNQIEFETNIKRQGGEYYVVDNLEKGAIIAKGGTI